MSTTEVVMTAYRGYDIVVNYKGFVVTAPNGDSKRFTSMASARAWISRHRALL